MMKNWFVVPARGEQPAHILVCFHHAGGAASSYYQLAQTLKQRGIEVWAVPTPGRENRLSEPPLTMVRQVVEAAAGAIAATADAPYSLFGHSLGALAAFETARDLRDRPCRQPERLFVSGHGDPAMPRSTRPLHMLDDETFVAALSSRYGGIPAHVMDDPELLDVVRPALRADMRIVETFRYEPGPPPDFAIVALTGVEDDTL